MLGDTNLFRQLNVNMRLSGSHQLVFRICMTSWIEKCQTPVRLGIAFLIIIPAEHTINPIKKGKKSVHNTNATNEIITSVTIRQNSQMT